ncbi:unnamed protein product, partial [Ectocarpus sp. 4 AP-2014]
HVLAARREQIWLIGAKPCSAGETTSRFLCNPGRDTAAEKRREGGPANDRSVIDPRRSLIIQFYRLRSLDYFLLRFASLPRHSGCRQQYDVACRLGLSLSLSCFPPYFPSSCPVLELVGCHVSCPTRVIIVGKVLRIFP